MTDLPWIAEAKKHVGQQEVRDKKALMTSGFTAMGFTDAQIEEFFTTTSEL